MARTEVLSKTVVQAKIIRQINLLNSRIKEIQQQEADLKKNTIIYSLLFSIKKFFHDEVKIKTAKVNALKKLEAVVANGTQDKFLELSHRYAWNRYSLVFVGFNNKTERLFGKAADYFIEAKRKDRMDNSYPPYISL